MSGPVLFSFLLVGEPVAKGRPQVGRSKGGRPVVYTPEKTAAYERRLRSVASVEALRQGLREPMTGPLSVIVEAVFANTLRSELGSPHAVKPDADNVLKTLDALNGVVWKDDAQIARATVTKRRANMGEHPHLWVSVEQLQAFDSVD